MAESELVDAGKDPAEPGSRDELRQRNETMLRDKHPEAFARIGSPVAAAAAPVTVLAARNGQPTLRIKERFAHSRYEPASEAAAWLSRQSYSQQAHLVLFGFGLGYVAQALLRAPRRFNALFIIEPLPEVLRAAVTARDLSDVFADPRVHLLVGMSDLDVFAWLSRYPLVLMAAPLVILDWYPNVHVERQYFSLVRGRILDAMRTAASNIATVRRAGWTLLRNAALNLKEAITNPGVSRLFGAFRGVPAIIVSAGPSLDKNIAALHQVNGKLLVLATDTALRILQQHGLRPDLVFTADFNEVSREHFEQVPTHDIPLVFEIEASWASLEAYRGPRFVAASAKPFSAWVNTLAEDKGILPKGMSVAHFIFNIAVRLGCDPIIFIGQDLSFPGGFTHAQGTASRQEVESIRRLKREKLLRISSTLTGEEVLTNQPMYIYLRHFERLVQESGRTCINATEGGAGIAGTVPLPLREAIARYGCRDCAAREIFEQVRRQWTPPDFGAVLEKMRDLRQRAAVVEATAGFGATELERVIASASAGSGEAADAAQRLRNITAWTSTIREHEDVLRIIHADVVNALMQLIREGGIPDGAVRDKQWKDAANDFQEDVHFLRSVRQGAQFLGRCLEQSIADIQSILNRSPGR
ncbi:MAG: DUF115 domain-containing protein [Candidatus Omnitrophica bacterium]|nr:DUF115 domain-containing protein [Candidatus Omnitrophota bacterium]